MSLLDIFKNIFNPPEIKKRRHVRRIGKKSIKKSVIHSRKSLKIKTKPKKNGKFKLKFKPKAKIKSVFKSKDKLKGKFRIKLKLKARPKLKKKLKPKPKVKRKTNSQNKSKIKKIIKKKEEVKKTFHGKEIGLITHYFDKISVGVIALKGNLKVGDKIFIKGQSSDFTQKVNTMQVNHKNVLNSSKGSEVGIKVLKSVHRGDKIYKVKV